MEAEHDFDYKQSAENRRNSRRDFERGVLSIENSKFQMNDLMVAAMVTIAAVLSFTDFSFSAGNIRSLTALTLFLYIITLFVYRNRYESGMARGRTDAEYLKALEAYRELRGKISDKNLASRVPEFCAYYKKKELREYRESLLCDIEMDYDTYKEKYITMPKKDIMKLKISLEAKKTLLRCNQAKPVKLYPGMMLNESGEFDREKLIGKSGRQRERHDKRKEAITRAVYVLFGAAVTLDIIFNFSPATIIQWVVRMLPIVIAAMSGNDQGFCNVTVTETNFKRDQTNVLGLFMEYIEKNQTEASEEQTVLSEATTE